MVPQNFTSVAGLEVNLPAMTHTLGVTAVLVIMTSPLLSDLVHYFLISLFVILFLPCHSWFKVLLIRLASLLAKMLLSPSVRWILSLQAVLSPQRGCLDHRNCSPTADTSCTNSCWPTGTFSLRPYISLAGLRRKTSGLPGSWPLPPDTFNHVWYFSGLSWQYHWCARGREAEFNSLRARETSPVFP